MTKLKRFFSPDFDRYEGVRPVNILLMRVLYGLMFLVLGNTVWGHILSVRAPWDPYEAVAWSVWAGFSAMAGLGLLHPLKMIPILLLEVIYKVLWLVLVALPLSVRGEMRGSGAEEITGSFVLVVLPIVFIPWGYALKTYLLKSFKGKGRMP